MNERDSKPSRSRERFKQLASFALLPGALVLALTLAWWVAQPPTTGKGRHASGAGNYPRALGPASTAICGPNGVPRQPPPVDSPLGRHLYANSRRGEIHPLPAMAIADALMPPASTGHAASSSTARQSSGSQSPGVSGGIAVGLTTGKTSSQPEAAQTTNKAGGGSNSQSSVPRNETAQDDVATVAQLLEEYRRVFGAMPVGEQNEEIVRCLQGDNPLGIAVLPKDHPAINADGELLDRFGTPYRFHPESAWVMTVRSAGPDKRMWTSDDIISTQGSEPTNQMLLTGAGP